jgi:siderophore synthetase component
LRKLDLPQAGSEEVLIPCLARQLPAITSRFPSARVLAKKAITASAQASIRTVVVPRTLQFEWDLKLALACTITSALRTITPWTACVGPELSAVLSDLLPENTWICREVASVTGSQEDYDEAKHISCVLRESHEVKADAANQTLIIAAALAETPYGETECYATLLFELRTADEKVVWLEE